MDRRYELESRSWIGAGDLVWPLRGLPQSVNGAPYGVRDISIMVTWDITTGAGGGCDGPELMRWLSNIELTDGSGVTGISGISAYEFYLLRRYLEGVPQSLPDAVPVSQTNVTRTAMFILPCDDEALSPKVAASMAFPASALEGGNLRIRAGVAALNANTTINSCVVSVNIRLRTRGKHVAVNLPQFRAHNDTLGAALPDGVYVACALAGPFTAAADIQNITVRAGSRTVHESLQPDTILLGAVQDMTERLGGITLEPLLPVPPWSDRYSTALIFPLIWGRARGMELTELVDTAGGSLKMDIDGTLSSPRYLYHVLPPLSAERVKQQINRAGIILPTVRTEDPALGRVVAPSVRIRVAGLRAAPLRLK